MGMYEAEMTMGCKYWRKCHRQEFGDQSVLIAS
jgi:hypothetical protein